ncbi:HDIG domain-containing protein [Thiospirochaeta perfilievii]|uniref:HDIG domain-containing protein n=1 Tax=Thiospirochaeta perfilievii TaxID=252967 RepID=A0A5C1QE38_9SPIO|nr:HDIG domain-containing metalloprotein [Thiospirochaeta perfilievii]QEN05851.1 HDIG domain-containing protein [Thiospirochaeta perfilievii]
MKNKFYLTNLKQYLSSNSLFTNIFVLMSFLLSVVFILFFNYFIDAFFNYKESDFRVGQPAKSDYVLKSDLSYFNEFETNIAKGVEEQLVLPVYKIDDEITSIAISELKAFYQSINSLLEGNSSTDLIIERINDTFPDLFTSYEMGEFLKLDLRHFFSLLLTEQRKILNRGYISESGTSNGSGLISVISSDDGTLSQDISAISVLKSIKIDSSLYGDFEPYFSKLLTEFMKVNCFYDNDQTKHNKDLALLNVKPVIDYYRSGEILIKKDFVVSSDIHKKIMEAEILVKKNTISNIFLVLGYMFLIYVAAIVLFTSGFIQKKLNESDVVLLAGMTLFYVLFAVLLRYFIGLENISIYPLLLPSILVSMLITFLLGSKVGLYHSILTSFLVLLISDFSIYAFSITLMISILSTIVIHDVEKRIDLMKSSGELAILQTVLILYMLAIDIVKTDDLLMLLFVSVGSSLVFGILTLALLPLSEHLLKISTCFQLTELCDLNAPLLKSMLIKAPGTYAHSIAVANMAESAAQNIGANALLAKAGGYYHDIGKIDQPHYFIENQKGGKNMHDDMKPSLSVAVIKSHVKLGIEKGKKIGLPSDIIDIIEQHHGKGAISFFLDKAKKESKGGLILTEDFGYSGPNPQSPEAAIVMLGDSVEAAVRSLKNPTISQLEKFVWELILNKLKEGMLDACGLTLSDLTSIKDSFISTLMGHYHSRIEYPTGADE